MLSAASDLLAVLPEHASLAITSSTLHPQHTCCPNRARHSEQPSKHLGFGSNREGALLEGAHAGTVAARAFREEQHRSPLLQQLLALVQAGHLATPVQALQGDVPWGPQLLCHGRVSWQCVCDEGRQESAGGRCVVGKGKGKTGF